MPPVSINILDRINIHPHLDATLAQQLKQQINWFIASGQLQPGDVLPSVRQVARHFHININTVRSAYQKLEVEGLVETRQGLGTRVLPYNAHRLSRLASSLISHTVGVIIPSLSQPFYHPFLQGVESIANQDRTLLFMCETHDDLIELQLYYAQLASRNVDGILVVSQDDSIFLGHDNEPGSQGNHSLPLVAVDWPPSTGFAINIELENAGYQATRHLLDHGHRKIGLITHALEFPNVRPINMGYQRALYEAGITSDPSWIAAVHGFLTSAGVEGARMLMSLEQPPTAIFAIADLLAIGAMCAIQQAGFKIPQDIAVVGCTDIPHAALVNPPLTTVAVPAYEMGQEAMKMLRSLIDHQKPAQRNILVPTSLVIRQSCGIHDHLSPC
jgi:DNA-binding LacI/PurR family transcriptional regulator